MGDAGREHWKTILPVIQAFVDGKDIEYLDSSKKWEKATSLNFNDAPHRYRVKPEPSWRPFRDAKEFEPHRDRWVREIAFEHELHRIDSYSLEIVEINYTHQSWDIAFERVVFEDGTPFGVLENADAE